MDMTFEDFNDIYNGHLDKLIEKGSNWRKMAEAKRLAYSKTEQDHIKATGKARFKNFESFQSTRSQTDKAPAKVKVDNPKRKRNVLKRTEFDSKFNWLF